MTCVEETIELCKASYKAIFVIAHIYYITERSGNQNGIALTFIVQRNGSIVGKRKVLFHFTSTMISL